MTSASLIKCCGQLPESINVRSSIGGRLERWPREALKCRVCGRKVEQYASDLNAKWNAAISPAQQSGDGPGAWVPAADLIAAKERIAELEAQQSGEAPEAGEVVAKSQWPSDWTAEEKLAEFLSRRPYEEIVIKRNPGASIAMLSYNEMLEDAKELLAHPPAPQQDSGCRWTAVSERPIGLTAGKDRQPLRPRSSVG